MRFSAIKLNPYIAHLSSALLSLPAVKINWSNSLSALALYCMTFILFSSVAAHALACFISLYILACIISSVKTE